MLFKVLFYFAIIAVSIAVVVNARSICDSSFIEDEAVSSGESFRTILNQTFSQYKQLDNRFWNIIDHDDKFNYGFACGREALCIKNNTYIENNKLVLRTKPIDPQQSPTNLTRVYQGSTAGVDTRSKFVIQPNGKNTHRICVRANLPFVRPYVDPETQEMIDPTRFSWPAIWTMGNATRRWVNPTSERQLDDITTPNIEVNNDIFANVLKKVQRFPHGVSFNDISDMFDEQYQVCNPDEFELDIIETTHGQNVVEVTGHWQEDVDKGITCQYPKKHRAVTAKYEIYREKTQDFDVEWGPDYIKFYINGQLMHNWDKKTTLDMKNEIPFYFNQTAPYFIILNSAYGGGMAGKLDEEWVAKYAAKEFFFTFDHVIVMKKDGIADSITAPEQENPPIQEQSNVDIVELLLNNQYIPAPLMLLAICAVFFGVIGTTLFFSLKACATPKNIKNNKDTTSIDVKPFDDCETTDGEEYATQRDAFTRYEKTIKKSKKVAMKQSLLVDYDDYILPDTEAV